MPGKMRIQEREIGLDEVRGGQILSQQIPDEELRFLKGRSVEQIVKIIVGLERLVGRGVTELAEVEPVIEEGVNEIPRSGIVEQAVCLRAQHVRMTQRALYGETAKLGVGWSERGAARALARPGRALITRRCSR